MYIHQGSSEMTKSPETMYFMVATDNHLGVHEKDPVRGNDSFAAFEEILRLAREQDVDGILLSGDLFHENKPSRKCLHTTMELLRHYCLGSRASDLELLSDPSVNFPGRFGTANYEDPNFNVAIPVFMIHGNHDDPTGDGNLSAIDLLSTAGLVNYFGKSREVDDITMMPVLLKKNSTQLALYGLGSMRDERLHRTFLSRKVKMLAPPENGNPWFNVLLFHQNRVAHGATSYIPESFLDDSLDLVIWGHEHDVQIEPVYVPQRDFYISQPGSSVVTSLSEGECNRPKTVAILEITGKSFVMKPIVLKTPRPFVMGDVSLSAATQPALNPQNIKGIEKFLCIKIDELAMQARNEWISRQQRQEHFDPESIPLPLVRLKVDYSNGFTSFNPHRFGHLFVGKVANPKEVIFFYRKRVNKPPGNDPLLKPTNEQVPRSLHNNDQQRNATFRMEDLVKDYLALQNLDLFPQNEFGDTVQIFVEKDDKDSIEDFVKKSLDRVCSNLEQQGLVSSYDLPTLKGAISKEKMQREMEWQRLHPGMDALLSHRRSKASVAPDTSKSSEDDDDEEDEKENNFSDFGSDDEMTGASKAPMKRSSTAAALKKTSSTTTTRGGRGRGRGGRGASVATSSLAMSSDPINANPAPSSAPRWPPRR